MAGVTGLEPAASCVTGRRSNQTELHPRPSWCKVGATWQELCHRSAILTLRLRC